MRTECHSALPQLLLPADVRALSAEREQELRLRALSGAEPEAAWLYYRVDGPMGARPSPARVRELVAALARHNRSGQTGLLSLLSLNAVPVDQRAPLLHELAISRSPWAPLAWVLLVPHLQSPLEQFAAYMHARCCALDRQIAFGDVLDLMPDVPIRCAGWVCHETLLSLLDCASWSERIHMIGALPGVLPRSGAVPGFEYEPQLSMDLCQSVEALRVAPDAQALEGAMRRVERFVAMAFDRDWIELAAAVCALPRNLRDIALVAIRPPEPEDVPVAQSLPLAPARPCAPMPLPARNPAPGLWQGQQMDFAFSA